jgi:hypothetical protein
MQQRQPLIRNKTERILVILFLIFTIAYVGYEFWYIPHQYSGMYSSKYFNHFFREFGSKARLILFVVIAHYVLKIALQKQVFKGDALKQRIILLSRFIRRFHVPLSILAFGLILIHAVGAILNGLKFDFNYLTGLLALIVLLPIPISGIMRYKKLDRKWHLRLGVTFAVLFLIHSYL